MQISIPTIYFSANGIIIVLIFLNAPMANEKKYALITGATSSIGLELVRLFAKDGDHLIIIVRSEAELEQTSGELIQQTGIKVIKFSTDLFTLKQSLC